MVNTTFTTQNYTTRRYHANLNFIQRTKTIYYTESIIAKENKQLVYHNKKWEKLIPFVQDAQQTLRM